MSDGRPPGVRVVLEGADSDLGIVDRERLRLGLPPGQMRWVCQHSCPEATIPDCTDMNCEAALVEGDSDVEALRGFARRGELALFGATPLAFLVEAPSGAAKAAARWIAESGSRTRLAPARGDARHARGWSWTGSLLDFAREMPRMAREPVLAEFAARAAERLRQQYNIAAPLLLDQRVVTVGARPSVGVIALEARGDPPPIARVAWGEPQDGVVQWRRALVLDPRRGGAVLHLTKSWTHLELGEYLGPRVRVEAWVDEATWKRSLELRAPWKQRREVVAAGEACLGFFVSVAERLGLPRIDPPGADPSAPYDDFRRLAFFVRGLVEALPLAGTDGT